MTIKKLIFLIAASAFLNGCSIKGSIDDLTTPQKATILGEQRGFSNGATASEVVNGYRVSTSVGSYTDGIQQTKNGYVIYSGLQGSSSSEVSEPE